MLQIYGYTIYEIISRANFGRVTLVLLPQCQWGGREADVVGHGRTGGVRLHHESLLQVGDQHLYTLGVRIVNRPGVAWAVLQAPLSFINSLITSPFSSKSSKPLQPLQPSCHM